MLDSLRTKERPLTYGEIVASTSGFVAGLISLYLATTPEIEARPIIELGTSTTAILGLGTGTTILYRATFSNFPEVAKGYATSGVEKAKNLTASGLENARYIGWCAIQSTKNVANTIIISTHPAIPSPTL